MDLHPTTAHAIDDIGDNQVELVFVGDSDEAYFELLSALWANGESFCIIEHDVAPTVTEYHRIVGCDQLWCGALTPYFNGNYDGLGLVKFEAAVLKAIPNAMELVGEIYDDTHPPKHWCRLDAWLQRRVLPEFGLTKHIHDSVIGHSHTEPSHGCHKR